MRKYVLDLQEIDRTRVDVVGGKGAQLGELARIAGVRVPPGFCVTTDAFRRIRRETPSMDDRLDRLQRLDPDDHAAVRALSARVRQAIEETAIPDGLAAAITEALGRLDEDTACAVRSSATGEDSASASFAGQHDSYLGVVGRDQILRHVRRCWASLFTERAVSYRMRHDADHQQALMAVVVQRMVEPDAAGVLFTADPVTGNRKVACVEAVPGLGEALVSGLVDADVSRVRDGAVVARTSAAEQRAGRATPQPPEADRRTQPTLTDAQAVRLAELGRRIEAHFGAPQDIEWCLADDDFQIVQSRPITTLFPVPVADDEEPHVYVSVGHQQMMTDAMKSLGLSLHQHVALPRMYEAGGRLFVDVAPMLASPQRRAGLLALGQSDPLMGDALQAVIDRGFVPSIPDDGADAPGWHGGPHARKAPAPIETDPAIVAELVERTRSSLATLERDIRATSGTALVDFVLADIGELKRLLSDPLNVQAIMAGMEATWWLNDHVEAWLGERNVADALTQSAPGNVTSEMGLALLDVADAIRPYPDVVAFLERVEDDDFLDRLPALVGGAQARDSIVAYLDRYGMRCVGEIDVTRPRWSERPSTLVPLLLGNVRSFEHGEAERRFGRGRRQAAERERELLERLRALADGEQKAEEAKRMIDRVRTFIGYREYPKYGMVCRYFVYKQALLREAERLVRAGVLAEQADVFHLTLEEVREALRTNRVDDQLIARRKRELAANEALTPPRVLTSEGEVVAGSYRRDDAPEGALVGLAVSAGTVEGRARVVLEMTDADLEPGDILVTAYTDPSWSPLFVAAAALVTEVGGLMTHGAVVAREYGLPAVVGVEQATRLIRDGQRIRVDGTNGYVEILS